MDEIRNQLLLIRSLKKSIEKNEDIDFYLMQLLERFEIDIKRKKEDLQHELEKVENNIEVLEIVKKEVLKNGR